LRHRERSATDKQRDHREAFHGDHFHLQCLCRTHPGRETPLGHRLFRVGKKEGRVTGPPSCIGVDWLDRYGLIFRPGHCENAVKFPPFPNGAAARQPKLLSPGGSVPSRALLETAMAHVCKDIICRYGTTELGLVADAPATDVLDNPGLIGRVIPDIELAVFGRRGQRLSPGQVGIVKGRIKSWIGDLPEEDAHKHPWIETGDVGWLTKRQSVLRHWPYGRSRGSQQRRGRNGATGLAGLRDRHVVRLEWDAADAAVVLPGSPRSIAKMRMPENLKVSFGIEASKGRCGFLRCPRFRAVRMARFNTLN
jgi:hypothetical protein